MHNGQDEKEKLKSLVAEVLKRWGPDKTYMVSNVAVIAEIIDADGQPTVININTMGNNPWMLLGVLRAEVLRSERRIEELNQLTIESHKDDEIGD